ncbi:alpha beta-hydrolase [Pyrrhoderma noxium]|uniref:Alpha beta-hydrolase n=1 Tax=Pyrrhoderma noxium TaxID=2282107 RepID=A0A286UPV7_9AGAM|nr:alpha beta-hydrolase [Pyrrhoderma noxium]
MINLRSETLSVKSSPSFNLTVLAKRYTPELPYTLSDDPKALSLIFCHAQGFFKEVWEPVIQRLLLHVNESSEVKDVLKIKEIYSIESPNHGESATLNEEALDKYYLDSWTVRDYTRAVNAFLTTGLENRANTDFTKRKLIGIGHSMGAAALVMLVKMAPQLSFEQFVFVEAAVSRPDIPQRFQMQSALTYLAWTRRDVWTSPESAINDFKSNPVFSSWDPRIFDLYMQYALRVHPAAKYPKPYQFKGITTALTKRQEAAAARDEELIYGALTEYAELTRQFPVHVIFGDTPDISPVELQKVHSDPELGCYPRSISYIHGVGHLAIQQAPDATADKIFDILYESYDINKPRL